MRRAARSALARDLRGARDDVRVRWAQCVARVSLREALGRAFAALAPILTKPGIGGVSEGVHPSGHDFFEGLFCFTLLNYFYYAPQTKIFGGARRRIKMNAVLLHEHCKRPLAPPARSEPRGGLSHP